LHQYFTAQTFNDADQVRVFAARWHEIDQPHGAALGFNFRVQNERLSTITAARRRNLFFRKKAPMAIRGVSEKRRKASRRIEPWKAKPIDAPVATHQRAGLRVAQERIVLDLCKFHRHSDSSSCSCS